MSSAEIAALPLRPCHPTAALWAREADIRQEFEVAATRQRVIALKEAAGE